MYGETVGDEVVAGTTVGVSAEWWRPTRALSFWLCGLLVLQAVLNAVLAGIDDGAAWIRLHDALSVSGNVSSTRASHALDDIQPWTSITGWVSAAVLVLLIVWAFRSAHNALAAGRTGARQSPGWVIAGWLVPLVNLVVPYQVMSDLWRSSEPDAARGDEWRTRGPSSLVMGWWMLWVVGGLAVAIGACMGLIGDFAAADVRPLLLAGHLGQAVASVLAVIVVRTITGRQTTRQEADPAPTSRPLARQFVAPTSADGPGWYSDPSRHYDHRYWDGSAWTEHVSTAGVPSLAPVTPPDWYPDPTGRFHWRYWTGHEWTEHVSRDQALYVDPLDGDAP